MTLDFSATDGQSVFPGNCIVLVAARLQALYPNTSVVMRRLHPGELTQTFAVFPMQVTPDETTYELGSATLQPGQTNLTANQPTISTYMIGVQALATDSDETSGILTHGAMSNAVKRLLYNDAPLGVGLNSLVYTAGGVTEKIQARRIRRIRYLDGQISGTYVYLSTTEYSIDTESK